MTCSYWVVSVLIVTLFVPNFRRGDLLYKNDKFIDRDKVIFACHFPRDRKIG